MSKRPLLAVSDDEDELQPSARPASKSSARAPPLATPKAPSNSSLESILDSTFLQILKKCGLTPSTSPSKPHLGDAASIRVLLERELRQSDNARMKTILTDLQNAIRHSPFLHASLLPILNKEAPSDMHHAHLGARDESLIKLLLNVSALQSKTMEALLEQMPLLQHQSTSPDEPLALLRLAIAQFRWLDIAVVDARALAEKLVELLTGCPDPALQREIISLIPDVIDDANQGTYVEALNELAASDSSMRLPVIDALSNLNLAPKFHDDVRRIALDALRSCRDEEVPVIIRFIMRAADSVEEMRPLLQELRVNVTPSPQASSPQRLVLEALKQGFQVNRHAVTAYIKLLSSLNAGDARAIDVWLLIALLSLGQHRKAAESALKKLAGAKLLTAAVLRQAITGHATSLEAQFPLLLNLVDRFIRSAEPAERELGIELAVLCFREFGAGKRQVSYHQQEVIGNLVSHIGSAAHSEVDASLTALYRLCSEDAVAVVSYASTLKGMLEYLPGLVDADVCRMFEILSHLSLTNDKRGVEIVDALNVVIEKRLSSSSLHDRRVGILGAVALLRLPATTAEHTERATLLLSKLLLSPRKAHVMPLALEFAYDELVSIGRTHGVLAEQMSGPLGKRFQDSFMIFTSEESENSSGANRWDGLGKPGVVHDGVVNIMPLVQSPERRPEVTWLAAQFRLVLSCMSPAQAEQDWTAALTLPLTMFPREHLTPSEFTRLTNSAQNDICTALFVAHGWFRELLNAFTPLVASVSSRVSLEMRGYLLARLARLPELESTLGRLAATCGWRPPSSDDATVAAVKGRGRGRKDDEKKTESSVDLSAYYRPLDPNIAPLLSFSAPNLQDDSDSLHTQKPPKAGPLSTAELQIVLSALHAPLVTHLTPRKQSLSTQDRVRRLPPAVQVIRECVGPSLGALRSHCTWLLQEISNATASEKAAVLSVISLAFSVLERSLLLSATDEPLQRQVLAAWTGNDVARVSRDELGNAALSDFSEWVQRVEDFNTGVAVFNAALALDPLDAGASSLPRMPAVRARLSSLALAMLGDHNYVNCKPKAEHLRLLLSVFVRYNDDPLGTLMVIATDALPSCAAKAVQAEEAAAAAGGGDKEEEVEEIDGDKSQQKKKKKQKKGDEQNGNGSGEKDDEDSIPLLTLATFPHFYRAALQELTLVMTKLTATLEQDQTGSSLESVEQACKIFNSLTLLLKAHHTSRTVLIYTLRYCKPVVEAALRWFPSLTRLFGQKLETHRDTFRTLVSQLQKGGRELQVCCADSKVKRDATLVALVPPMRKTLEALVFQVRALTAPFALRKEAAQVLHLKHKTLAGAEVSSQVVEDEVVEEEAPKRKRKAKGEGKKKKTTTSKKGGGEEEEGEGKEEEKREKTKKKKAKTKKSKDKDEEVLEKEEEEDEEGAKEDEKNGDGEGEDEEEGGEEEVDEEQKQHEAFVKSALESDSESSAKEEEEEGEEDEEGEGEEEEEPKKGTQRKRRVILEDD